MNFHFYSFAGKIRNLKGYIVIFAKAIKMTFFRETQ